MKNDITSEGGSQSDLPTLAIAINAADTAVKVAADQAITNAIEAGRLLVLAKKRVGHGDWLGWIASNTTVSVRTAQVYQQLYEGRDRIEKRSTAAHLSVRSALKLLAEPTELANAEADIEVGLERFLEGMTAIRAIRKGRLYRERYPNFGAYCTAKLGVDEATVQKYLELANALEASK